MTGNSDDLVITCNGVKTAESIADLVDGYCRLVSNTELSLWDRSVGRTPTNSATNSLEKQKQHHQQQQPLPKIEGSQLPLPPPNLMASNENPKNDIHQQQQQQQQSSSGLTNIEMSTPILSEDYVDIGLGEEEGDYSTPAARNYELDRTQITLNEIIGIGQFGDVHIGICRINKTQKPKPNTSGEDSSQTDGTTATNGTENPNEDSSKAGVIHVAVKTCKADADMITAEKFLEEACEY